MSNAPGPLVIGRSARAYRLPVVIDSELPKTDQMEIGRAVLLELADGRLLYIRERFVSDAHSTPVWSWSVLPAFNNKTNLAAYAHDYLYMRWEEFAAVNENLPADGRAYADSVYLELMERMNPGRFRNRLYYAGVRLFGGLNWQRFRAKGGQFDTS